MAAGSVVRLASGRTRRRLDADDFSAARKAELERLRAEVAQLEGERDRLARELKFAHDEAGRARRQAEAGAGLGELKRRLREAGIAQDAVARAALVGKTMVSHVLAGRSTSRRVVAAAERLLADSHRE